MSRKAFSLKVIVVFIACMAVGYAFLDFLTNRARKPIPSRATSPSEEILIPDSSPGEELFSPASRPEEETAVPQESAPQASEAKLGSKDQTPKKRIPPGPKPQAKAKGKDYPPVSHFGTPPYISDPKLSYLAVIKPNDGSIRYKGQKRTQKDPKEKLEDIPLLKDEAKPLKECERRFVDIRKYILYIKTPPLDFRREGALTVYPNAARKTAVVVLRGSSGSIIEFSEQKVHMIITMDGIIELHKHGIGKPCPYQEKLNKLPKENPI